MYNLIDHGHEKMYVFCQRPLIRKNWIQRVGFFKNSKTFCLQFFFLGSKSITACWCINDIIPLFFTECQDNF